LCPQGQKTGSFRINKNFELLRSRQGFVVLLACTLILGIPVASAQKAFGPGEKLNYKIYYGLIHGGEAVLEVRKGDYKGKPANHIYMAGKTVGLANKFYYVEDIYESYTDPETDWPYFSIRNIHENRYRHYSTQVWDHWSRKDSSIVNSSKTGEVVVVKGCQDILSSFYYLRNILIKSDPVKDQLFIVDTYFTDEKFPLMVRFKGRETIKTSLGEFRCLKFMPVVEVGRVFKTQDDMTIWLSDDDNLVPVRVRFEIFVGAFYCDLYSFSGLKNPFSSYSPKVK
jgi:hypothetical protein